MITSFQMHSKQRLAEMHKIFKLWNSFVVYKKKLGAVHMSRASPANRANLILSSLMGA